MTLLRRIPAHVLNGIAVALGIGLIQFVITAVAGHHAAQLALSGAVCASLADVPNTLSRTRSRVPVAAVLSVAAALVVALLDPHPVALGFGIGAIAFVAMMTMAWGPRAGAVSFAPILSLVFTMAVPESSVSPWVLAGWTAVGAAAYFVWSLAAGAVLQRRLRTLSLAQALRTMADLFRLRAALLASAPDSEQEAAAMRAWIAGETAAAERLQTARDFVFIAPDSDTARRNIAILLRLIDLRDVLLASRLDLDLLGNDNTARWVLGQVSSALQRIGESLEAAAGALRDGEVLAAPASPLGDVFADAPVAAHDARMRLLPAVVGRLHNLNDDVARIQALLDADPDTPVLSRTELQNFVAPEGWPLAALKAQLSGASPVFRHAVRSALALGAAYFIALASPWASHPHWLVLGVAVVLRGNLEQTLARRNARVLGTLVGCVVVLGLSLVHSPFLLGAVFLLAVGTAHAFVLKRYWLTATAATVMALLQAHLVHPAGGFAIPERVADTVLGAALAWAFSYVLPSWERRSLPGTLGRTLKELADYAAHALTLAVADGVAPRLARRRAYDAIEVLAGLLQRTGAEPEAVRLPVQDVAKVLDHGQRLMAHLSVVRMILSRRRAELDEPVVAAALAATAASVAASLALHDTPPAAVPDDAAGGLSMLPMEAPARDVMPWLLRRLHVLETDARRIQQAANEALVKVARQ
ncbi:FUSC family membrane protein [Rhizobacter sp. Root1221]|uniref:FUSC family protein n=1 Tax=Rhizobacter sp. Root1221 TaxID=1736433 RepID=UPI0006FD69C6|nr:FUSC family membrane protein [Rhizobacter sp. Root1221]KQV78326.1 hypothetical protein ASC87_12085 [Rhizobacter sp. Root1221]